MRSKKVIDLFEIKKGKKLKQVDLPTEATVRYIQIEDLRGEDNLKICEVDNKTVLVNKKDIIIAWDGANAGTVGFEVEGAIGSTLAALKLKDDVDKNIIDTRYVARFLQQKEQYIRDNCTGATIPHVSRKVLENIEIPLPPIQIQRKIVDSLDKLNTIMNKRKEQISALTSLKQSVFVDMFGDPVRNNYNWKVKTLPEFVDSDKYAIKRGPFGGSLKKDIFVNKGYLVYEQFHAINDDFSMKRYYITKEKYEEMTAFKVKPKDLIISCSGVTLGRIAEVHKDAPEGIINQALLKITLNNEIMNNAFFINMFRTERMQQELFGISRGSGIPNFPSMDTVKSIEFICPPLELQIEFESILNMIKYQEERLNETLKELKLLHQSIIQKVLKGDLFTN